MPIRIGCGNETNNADKVSLAPTAVNKKEGARRAILSLFSMLHASATFLPMGQSNPEHTQEVLYGATYLELGRFVVHFSAVVGMLSTGIEFLIGGTHPEMIRAAMGERTAEPIVAAFFSVFHVIWDNRITSSDAEILRALRNELTDLIQKRNRMMHDWWTYDPPEAPARKPMTTHRNRQYGKGVESQEVTYTADEIRELSQTAERLVNVIRRVILRDSSTPTQPGLSHLIEIRDGVVHPLPLSEYAKRLYG